MSRYEIRLAGEGGQGLRFMGLVLAEALTLHQNQKVAMTVRYTPQQRGGLICTDIVVSSEEIDYPKVLKADLVVALSQGGFDQCFSQMKQNALIITDSSCKASRILDNVIIKSFPLREISQEITHSEINTNIVALGAVSSFTGIVSAEALFAVLKTRIPVENQEASKLALEAGISLGKKSRQDSDLQRE